MPNEFEKLQNEVRQLRQELNQVKNFTTNLGGSLEFRNLVERYSGGGDGAVGTFSTININGDINHDGDKIGFFGTTPVSQEPAITSPSGGSTVDSEARSAIGDLIGVVEAYGLTQ